MNNFLKDQLSILKNKKFLFPEIELRTLLNKTSVISKEIIFSNFNINQIDIIFFKKVLRRRLKNEPISKIFNEKNFWKYNFYINKEVLDPRPETELIIEEVLSNFKNKEKKLKILDIGTGSGCLSISLAKEYCRAKITATDISLNAIKVAKFNALKKKCEHQIDFVKHNIIKKLKIYDIIVCNPPYLSSTEYENCSKEVRLFDPKIALVSGKDGFEFYKKLADILPKLMNLKSIFYVEIGYSQKNKCLDIFNQKGLKCIKIVKDYQNINRILVLKLNNS